MCTILFFSHFLRIKTRIKQLILWRVLQKLHFCCYLSLERDNLRSPILLGAVVNQAILLFTLPKFRMKSCLYMSILEMNCEKSLASSASSSCSMNSSLMLMGMLGYVWMPVNIYSNMKTNHLLAVILQNTNLILSTLLGVALKNANSVYFCSKCAEQEHVL